MKNKNNFCAVFAVLMILSASAFALSSSDAGKDLKPSESSALADKASPLASLVLPQTGAPIKITSGHGYGWWQILGIKNTGSVPVIIKGIESSNSTKNSLYYGSSLNPANYGPYTGGGVTDGVCTAGQHSARACNIVIQPGQTTYFFYVPYGPSVYFIPPYPSNLCGWKYDSNYDALYWNSFRAIAYTNVKVYHTVGSAVPSESDSVAQLSSTSANVGLTCYDYNFRCTSDRQCRSRYNPNLTGICTPSGMCQMLYH